MELILCIVVSLTTLDPMSLGTILYLNVVLGTLERHWMLVSFIRKVVSPCDNWRQARMGGEGLAVVLVVAEPFVSLAMHHSLQ